MRVLGALDGLGGLAPQLLAADPGGGPVEGPWVLISRLPGLADITPADPPGFARQLGESLARIHATANDRLAGFPRVFDRPGESCAALHGPAASLVLARWESLATEPTVLTHNDFWSATPCGRTALSPASLTGPAPPSAPAPSIWAGADWTSICCLTSTSPTGFWSPTKRRAESLAKIRCWRTCGPPPAHTPPWGHGSRTTAILAVPT
jgi:phosphotransferase family enzyme